nr:uncharacterized protein LOC112037270 [Quercus suber]
MLMIVSPIFILELLPIIMGTYLVNDRSSALVTLYNGLGFSDSQLHEDVVRDWSELDVGVVHEIVSRLHVEDIMAAAGVSRTWRFACFGPFGTASTSSHQLPWLMHCETPYTNMRQFFSLYNSNCYQLGLPAICGKRVWGSQHGWVVALGSDYKAHLVHLMKRKQIALPPLDTIRGAAPEEWFRLVHKFILFKDSAPDHELSFLVFAIFGPRNNLAFARVRGGAALNRREEGEWAIVPYNFKFKDVACFQNQIYGLCDNGTLVRFELDAHLLGGAQVIPSHPQDVQEPQKLYLVGSLENLYMVARYGKLIPWQRRHKTTRFLVYKFNLFDEVWEEVRDLEYHALFVGDGNSWCIPTNTIPSRNNQIYFTDDHWDWQMYLGASYGGGDVGVFNMASRDFEVLPFGECIRLSYSRPVWVTPCID